MRIGIPYKRFIFFILVLCVFALQPADAKIKGSKNIETLNTIKLLDKFPTLDKSFPSHLDSDKDVYVVYYAAASSSDFYVLTRPSVEPIRLARVVETAIKGTPLEKETVYYLHYGVYSWADVYSEHPKMWSRSAETRHHLGTMLAGLRKAGFKPHTLLCVFKSAKVPDELNKVKHSGRKWNVINVTNTSANLNFTLRTSISKSYFTRVILTTFAVPLIGIIAMPVLIIIAKSRRSTPEGRRSYFTGRYFWVMLICFCLSITAQSNLIFSPMRLKLHDLWSGLGLPLPFLLLLMLPLASFILIAVSKLVAHLVFPGYSDITAKKPFRYKIRAYSQFAVIMAIILFADWLGKFLPRDSLFARWHPEIPILFSVLLASFFTRSIHRWKKMPGERTPDTYLLQRLSNIASNVGFYLKGVAIVDTPTVAKNRADILIHRNGILLIRREVSEKLLPEELDFTAAHEFIHAVRRHHLKATLLLIIEVLFVLIPGAWLITQPFRISLLIWPLIAFTAGLALMFFDIIWLSRWRERYADLTAVEATHNPEAAVQAVMKLSKLYDTKHTDIRDTTSFSIDAMTPSRLKWLCQLSKYSDSEALAIHGGTKEDEALTKRAKDIAASMGVTLNKVMVLIPALNKPLFNAGALRGARIVVGQALLEQFSDEEVDFVLAHELAHIKYRHLLKLVAGTIIGCIVMVVGAGLLAYDGYSIASKPYLILNQAHSMGHYSLWMALLGGLLMISSLTWLRRRREMEADRMALRFTRNLPAAISTLVKLNVQNKIEIPEELEDMMTHPKINYRLQSLRDEAKRLGLPDIESEEQMQV